MKSELIFVTCLVLYIIMSIIVFGWAINNDISNNPIVERDPSQAFIIAIGWPISVPAYWSVKFFKN